jgi:hypothetical protein
MPITMRIWQCVDYLHLHMLVGLKRTYLKFLGSLEYQRLDAPERYSTVC